MDLDWYFISDPLPGLAAARENRARLGCTGHPTGRPYLECVARSWATQGVAAEVVALHDGGQLKTLNVGLMFVRATDATAALARRVENRTRGGWEQGVFNEEPSWGLQLGGGGLLPPSRRLRLRPRAPLRQGRDGPRSGA